MGACSLSPPWFAGRSSFDCIVLAEMVKRRGREGWGGGRNDEVRMENEGDGTQRSEDSRGPWHGPRQPVMSAGSGAKRGSGRLCVDQHLKLCLGRGLAIFGTEADVDVRDLATFKHDELRGAKRAAVFPLALCPSRNMRFLRQKFFPRGRIHGSLGWANRARSPLCD